MTELARRILRPQGATDELQGRREAIQKSPKFSDVYNHFRGENLPDDKYLDNTLTDTFKIPADKLSDFKNILMASLESAKLIERNGEKVRVLDVIAEVQPMSGTQGDERLERLGKGVKLSESDSCFVMMPFSDPLGSYYEKIYEPAIRKTGLLPVRADNEIFGTGKIIDQVFRGINSARVLVAELTTRNANVFYELGLAHALKKPVVLISANEEDVPFDLKHIRVIYYDIRDPFWGIKLIDKVAENILSAIKNPEETMFETAIGFSRTY